MQDIFILNMETGEVYDEVIKRGRFSEVAWLPDDSGFFYNRYPDPDSVATEDLQAYNRLYFHKVGTPQSEDVLVYERPDAKALNFPPHITDDGRYIVLYVWHAAINRNRVYYREVSSTGDFVRLIDEADADYNFLGNVGTHFYFLTDLDAPRGRVILIDITKPERDHWQTVIPEGEDSFLFARMIGGRLILVTQHHAAHRILLYEMDGTFEREIELPSLGTVFTMTGKSTDDEMFFDFVSYLYQPTVYRYDFKSGTLSTFAAPNFDFDVSRYETKRVFVTSKDGTRLPMFLTHKKGIELNGDNPTYLYAYGGFSVSISPDFNIGALNWVENGGVHAVACLRGGGEYGEEWHKSGMLENKQNVFDDFIAAAEWLIANKYTRKEN